MQELVKHTQDAMEKENLRLALDAMRVSSHTQGDSCTHPGQCRTVPPRHTVTPMGNTSPHHKAATCITGHSQHPLEDTDMLWTLSL